MTCNFIKIKNLHIVKEKLHKDKIKQKLGRNVFNLHDILKVKIQKKEKWAKYINMQLTNFYKYMKKTTSF